MKKTTKTSSSPAPAKKKVVPAKAPAPAKVAKPVKAAKPAAAKPAKSVKKTPATAVPEIKKAAPAPVVTTIIADIDVGFGNSLYVRGEGPGLSWEKGVVLSCVSDDKWSITFPETSRPVVFKFLLNDNIWSAGEDYSVASGDTVTLVPQF